MDDLLGKYEKSGGVNDRCEMQIKNAAAQIYGGMCSSFDHLVKK